MRRWIPLILILSLAVGCSPPPGIRVGNTALPVEGNDVTGKPITLDDYRGKVVVVDFWATWCKYCVQMIPHEKELVKRMEGRPFVLLGVSVDTNPFELKTFLDKHEMKWPNIFDGRNGPNTAKWEIFQFPTVYVIDAKGVIRYRDIDGPQLDRAVEKLVAEAESGQ